MKSNIDELPCTAHSDKAIALLEAAEVLGFQAYYQSPDKMPRRFTHDGETYSWQNMTSALYAKAFRQGYRAAKAAETK